jgi:osmoprotectant transport system ATP-binding protein
MNVIYCRKYQRMNYTIIDIVNVTKSYETGHPVLNQVSLNIRKGDFVTIIGPSGCGKTTLLRIINAMTGIDAGRIMVMGRDIDSWNKIELRRNIGYVIQQGGLFPHLTVRQNMEFVLSLSGTSREIINDRIFSLAEMMDFDQRQLDAWPANLSGGQQQRVGVARALSANPGIVLMDEPFGALDNITRRNLQGEIKALHEKSGSSFVMVTHDLHEAFTLGTKVAIMNQGKIEQYDTPERINKNPASEWVEDFLV